MQQKKTQTIDVSDLPDLTPKQEAFARGLLDGLSASDAYRAAYDCSNMQNHSIWTNASKLKTDAKIALWVERARIAGLERGALTHEQFVNRLLELAARAEKAGNYGAAVQALNTAGKAQGHLIEKIEDVTPTQVKETREKLEAMASKANIQPVTQDDTEHRITH